MVDIVYSKKLYKRIIFITICIVMTFLLSVTMFHKEAIAKVRDDLSINFPKAEESGFDSNTQESSDDGNFLQANTQEDKASDNNNDMNEENNNSVSNSNNKELDNEINSSYLEGSGASDSLLNYNDISREKTRQETGFYDSDNSNEDYSALYSNDSEPYQNTNIQQNHSDLIDSVQQKGESYSGTQPDWKLDYVDRLTDENKWWRTEDTINKDKEGGSGTKEDPYLVATKETLLKYLQPAIDPNVGPKIDGGDAPKKFAYIKLIDNIDLSDAKKANDEIMCKALLPYSDFRGTLDGDGHTISCKHNVYTPFFHELSYATIQNCVFDLSIRFVDKENSWMAGDSHLYDNNGTLSKYACNDVNISNCQFNGCVINRDDAECYDEKNMGGIIGIAKGRPLNDGIKFSNVENNVEVEVNGTSKHNAGGFVGSVVEGADVSLEKCINNATVSTKSATSQFANFGIEFGKMIANILGTVLIASAVSAYSNNIWNQNNESLNNASKALVDDFEPGDDIKKNIIDAIYEEDINNKSNLCANNSFLTYQEKKINELGLNYNKITIDLNKPVDVTKLRDVLNDDLANFAYYYKQNLEGDAFLDGFKDWFLEKFKNKGLHYDNIYNKIMPVHSYVNDTDGYWSNVNEWFIKYSEVKHKINALAKQAEKTRIPIKLSIHRIKDVEILNDYADLILKLEKFPNIKVRGQKDILETSYGYITDLDWYNKGTSKLKYSQFKMGQIYINREPKDVIKTIFKNKNQYMGKYSHIKSVVQIKDAARLRLYLQRGYEFPKNRVVNFTKILEDAYFGWIPKKGEFNSIRGYAKIFKLLWWNKYTKNNMHWNFMTDFICKIKDWKTIINKRHQNFGKIKVNQVVYDSIKDILKELKEYIKEDDSAKDVLGEDLFNSINGIDLSKDDASLEQSSAYKTLQEILGNTFTKYFNCLTGNEDLFWNVYNQNLNSNDDEIKNLENVDDFLAFQGRLIYEGAQPVASVLNNDEFESFKNSEITQNIFNQLNACIQNSSDRKLIMDSYISLGRAYCNYCKDSNSSVKPNLAYKIENPKISLNYLSILIESCRELYMEERNCIEHYNSEATGNHCVTGSALIRNFMNGAYVDALEYTNFTKVWANKLYTKFESKILNLNKWDDNTPTYTDEQKKDIIKHFFNTYLTYSGEFSFNNYLPLTRAAISLYDADMYSTDFLSTNQQIKDNNLSMYVPKDQVWKFTNIRPGLDKPIEFARIYECSMWCYKNNIDMLFDEVKPEDKINEKITSLKNNEQSDTEMVSNDIGSTTVPQQENVFTMFEGLSSTLSICAQSLAEPEVHLFQKHFSATAGGYIGCVDDSTIKFTQCANAGMITGGDYAGGFIGLVKGNHKIEISACANQGSISATDEVHFKPSAGGFIGEISDSDVEAVFNKTIANGNIISRRHSGGFIGRAYGKILFEDCAACAGVASPRFCGGYVGMADDAISITAKNSYSTCVFDAESNAEESLDYINWSLNFLGIMIPQIPQMEKGRTHDKADYTKPGQFSGNKSKDNISFKNFYYKDGDSLIGGDFSSYTTGEAHAVSLLEFADGSIAYKLNNGFMETNNDNEKQADKEDPFGQILDNFDYGNRSSVPIPDFKAKVYKDLASEDAIYTNYDPRYTKLHRINFDLQDSRAIPDVDKINVEDSTGYTFNVVPNEGLTIDKVWYAYKSADGTEIKIDLNNLNTTPGNFEYEIPSIKTDIIVQVKTKEKDVTKPKGSGSDIDPYLISNKDELHWFNATMIHTLSTNVHAKLVNDIDYSGIKWKPIGSKTEGMGFSGCFDGNGHEISNIEVDNENSESGALFNGIEGSESNNFFLAKSKVAESLDNILIKEKARIAVPSDMPDLAYYLYTRYGKYNIDQKIVKCSAEGDMSSSDACIKWLKEQKDDDVVCYIPFRTNIDKNTIKILDDGNSKVSIKNLIIKGNFKDAGLAYSARNAKIENCIVDGNVSGNGSVCGGLIAYASKNIEVVNCINQATITFSSKQAYHTSCGGIIGSLTSIKYAYNNDDKPETYEDKINFLCAKISNCINVGYISASRVAGNYVEAGGIVGNISETDVDYKFTDDFSEKVSSATTLDSAYVLIDSCQNNANIGDIHNSYNLVAGGIIANEGLLQCKHTCICTVNQCINYGAMGCDNNDHETSVKSSAGIVCYANSNWKASDKNDWEDFVNSNKDYIPIIDLQKIPFSKNQIFNCINFGDIRQRGTAENSAQICGSVAACGLDIANCACANTGLDAFCTIADINNTKIDDIYCIDELTKNSDVENVIGNSRKWFKDSQMKEGKLTYDLCHVDLNLVANYKPKFGQNIDNLQTSNKIYPRQLAPFIIDDNTQEVYKKSDLKNYSKYSEKTEALYTNLKGAKTDEELNYKNSYKIDLVVKNEENNVNEDKQLGHIDGFTIVKHDEAGTATAEFEIAGVNGNILNNLKFANQQIRTDVSNTYKFKIKKNEGKYFYDNKEIKPVEDPDNEGYITFQLEAQFCPTKKPRFEDGYYLISNFSELKWYARHFWDEEACSKDGPSDNGQWNARLINDIYIFGDEYGDVIGDSNHKYQAKFIGGYKDITLSKSIINFSSKPIFGDIGSNAVIENIVCNVNYTIKKDSDKNWKAALAYSACGNNININHVVVRGAVKSDNTKSVWDSAAGFIARVNKDGGNNSSITIKNSTNDLDIKLYTAKVAGFIGECDSCELNIDNCSNNGEIECLSSYKNYCAGFLAYAQYSIDIDNSVEDNQQSKNCININGFTNNGYIHCQDNDRDHSYCGGILGFYTGYYENAPDKNANYMKLNNKFSNCINTGKVCGWYMGGFVGFCGLGDYDRNFFVNDRADFTFENCESNGFLTNLNTNSKVGGFIASVEDNYSLSFLNCLASCKMLVGKHVHYIGGLIGNVNSQKNINITNSSVVIDNAKDLHEAFKQDNKVGMLFGQCTVFDYDKENIKIDDLYYLGSNDQSLPWIISDEYYHDNDPGSYPGIKHYDYGPGLHKCSLNDYKSGKVAYKINSKINSKKNRVGQIVDLENTEPEIFPHFNGQEVYKPFENNERVYSNYSLSDTKDKLILDFYPCEDSQYTGLNKKFFFTEKDKSWQVNLLNDKYLKIQKLIIDNKEYTTDNFPDFFNNSISSMDIYNKNWTDKNIIMDFVNSKFYIDKSYGYHTIQYMLTDNFEPKEEIRINDKGEKEIWKIVTNAVELLSLTKNNKIYDTNIELSNDIDCSGIEWITINGFYNSKFYGNHHKINNLGGNCEAFISDAENSHFKDFELNVNFKSNKSYSAFIKWISNRVLIDNITVSGQIECTGNSMDYFGGIVGMSKGSKAYKDDDSILNKIDYIPSESDYFANLKGNIIRNCVNNLNSITFSSGYAKWAYCGGIVGKLDDYSNLSVDLCTNNADIKSSRNFSNPDCAGGIIGNTSKKGAYYSVYNSINTGKILGYYAGGMLGSMGIWTGTSSNTYSNIKSCKNQGEISGVVCGGIVGASQESGISSDDKRSNFYIDNCINAGNINCVKNHETVRDLNDETFAGGIIGSIDDGSGRLISNTYISNCANNGSVDSKFYNRPSGGIVGGAEFYHEVRVYNSYTTDKIFGGNNNLRHGITGTVCTYKDFIVSNSYVVGTNNIGFGPNDDSFVTTGYMPKGNSSYNELINGSLCAQINEHSVTYQGDDQACAYDNNQKREKRYLAQKSCFGQKLDKNDFTKVSKMYPEPNKQNEAPVYKIGNNWKNDNGRNFVQFDKSSNIYKTLYEGNNFTAHRQQLFSNYQNSTRGIHVNTWPYVKESDSLKYMKQDAFFGEVQIMEADGSLIDTTGFTQDCKKSLSCGYSAYFNTEVSDAVHKKTYKFVCKPNDGCVVSWIAIDGVIRDYEKCKQDEIPYNIIDSNYFNDGRSHTIDVGFSNVTEPSKIGDTYIIKSYSDLAWFSNYVNTKDSRANAELACNIESGYSSAQQKFVPLGDLVDYQGTFDGKGHSIKGLWRTANDHVAFVKTGNGCTIKNLKLDNVDFKATNDRDYSDGQACAAVVAVSKGVTVSNVEVSGILNSAGHRTGGIIGYIERGTNNIEHCINRINPRAASCSVGRVGGIVGWIDFNSVTNIDSCDNYGTIRSNKIVEGVKKSGKDYAGGIVAYCNCHDCTKLNICSSKNFGKIIGDNSGGIVGEYLDDEAGKSDKGQELKIENCNNLAPVYGNYCGGIIGRCSDVSENGNWININWCNNFSGIGSPNTASRAAGGIIGQFSDRQIKADINYCSNYGVVYAGGGIVKDSSNFILTAVDAAVSAASNIYDLREAIKSYYMTEYASSIGVPILGIVYSVTAMVSLLVEIIFMLINADFGSNYAGGICAKFNSDSKIYMSNVFNYGMASAEDDSAAITNYFDNKGKEINVYTINNYGKEDNTAKVSEHHNFKAEEFKKFKNGSVSYLIQKSGNAGKYFVEDKLVDVHAQTGNLNSVEQRVGDSSKKLYFGQNLDRYSSESGNVQPISSIPNYTYNTNEYKIYKFPDDYKKAVNDNSRVFYSNFNDLDEITSKGYSKLSINGHIGDAPNNNNFHDLNEDKPQNQDFDKAWADENNDEEEESSDFDEKNGKETKLEDAFDIIVTGSRSIGNVHYVVSDDKESGDADYKKFFKKVFNMFPNEKINILFTRKYVEGKAYTIKNISIPSSDDSGIKYFSMKDGKLVEKTSLMDDIGIKQLCGSHFSYLDDGSIEVKVNPRYIVQKNIQDQYKDCDMQVIYHVDGSVECHLNNGIDKESILDLDVDIIEGSPHVHYYNNDGKAKLFLPYSKKDCLPTQAGAWYLTEDITMDKDWIVPNGDTYLCLNGHKIVFEDGTYINQSKLGSNLYICDEDKIDNVKWYPVKSDTSDYDFVSDDAPPNTETQLLGGIIYSKGTCNQLIKMNKHNVLSISNVSLIQNLDILNLVYIDCENDADAKYKLYLNGPVYDCASLKKADKTNQSILKFSNTSHNSEAINSILFANNFNHCVIDKDTEKNIPDISLDSLNAVLNIKFDDAYNFEKHNSVSVYIDKENQLKDVDNALRLTDGFDKCIERGVEFNKVFCSYNNDFITALMSHEVKAKKDDIKNNNEEKTVTSYNDICICKQSDSVRLNLDIDGPGHVYPKPAYSENNVNNNDQEKYLTYYKGSKPKLYFIEDRFSYLESKLYFAKTNNYIDDVHVVETEETISIFGNTAINNDTFDKAKNIISFDKSIKNNIDAKENFTYYDRGLAKTLNCYCDNAFGVTHSLYARFKSYKDIDTSTWQDWGAQDYQKNTLPSQSDITSLDNTYSCKLVSDILLDNTWFVPAGKINLDLNGHSITIKAEEDTNYTDNVITINHSSTNLRIVDSSQKNENTPVRTFKNSNNGRYEIVNQDDNDDGDKVSIKGGLIFGANTNSDYYYKFEKSAGAIVVDKGTLNFVSGSIACNIANGRQGGAAVTVKEDGQAYFYENTNICNNVSSGDNQYTSNKRLFAGAIGSSGYVYNEGKIYNNEAKLYSASAVSVNKGSFENRGTISNNNALADSDKDRDHVNDSFSTVFIEDNASFFNYGFIIDNKANFMCPAVIAQGSLYIGEKQKICNNVWQEKKNDGTEEKTHVLDIFNNGPVVIYKKLEPQDLSASVVYAHDANFTLTQNWENSGSELGNVTIDKIFKIYEDNPNDLTLALGKNKHKETNEVRFATKDSVCKLDVWYYKDDSKEKQDNIATSNLNNVDQYISGEEINITVAPKEDHQLSNIKIDNEPVEISSKSPNKFNYSFKTWADNDKDDKGVCVIPVEIVLKSNKQKPKQDEKKKPINDFSNWNWDDNMPNSPGKYKLNTDVTLEDTWIPEEGDYVIDLNSHVLTINQDNKNIVYVNNDKTNITITDNTVLSNDAKEHYLTRVDDKYYINDKKYNDSDEVPVKGGLIGGAYFNNLDSEYTKSGAVFMEKGKLNFEAGSVVGNSIINGIDYSDSRLLEGRGSSAIYIGNEANAVLGGKMNISYNYSKCKDEHYFYGAAGLEVRGYCQNFATISNNIGEESSVAGVAVISSGSKFINYGKICDNTALKNSVAGLMVCSDDPKNSENKNHSESESVCFATNYGMICGNVASEHSIAAVELYGKLINTQDAKIMSNKSLDEDSYAGVYACGDLTLGGSSLLCQNIRESNGQYQDIKFEEDNYDAYEVTGPNKNGVKALFTLQSDFKPPVQTYTNGTSDGAKPLSLTHVTVENYEQKSGKTLLLANGFNTNERSLKDINSFFEANDYAYDISATADGSIYYNLKTDNAYLHVSANAGGHVNCLGDLVTPKVLNIPVNLDVVADEGYHIESVILNNQYPYVINDNKHFNVDVPNNNNLTSINVKFAEDYGSIRKNITKADNFEVWSSNKQLPTSAGCFKLTNDIYLQSTWVVPKVSPLIIDLNGHNITMANNVNEPILRINEKDSTLDIIDNNNDGKVKCSFTKDKSTGKFVKDHNGEYKYYSGCIYGGSAYYGGAAYLCENTYLSINGVNIIGNSAKFGGAIYNEGNFVAGPNSLIEGNVADDTAAAVYCTQKAAVQVKGKIKNNTSKLLAGGIYADGVFQICDDAVINNNEVKEKATLLNPSPKPKNSDVVFIEYNAQDPNNIIGTVINVLQSESNGKNASNNDNVAMYVSCIKDQDKSELFSIKFYENKYYTFFDAGIYVVCADGFYRYSENSKTKESYRPRENAYLIENK